MSNKGIADTVGGWVFILVGVGIWIVTLISASPSTSVLVGMLAGGSVAAFGFTFAMRNPSRARNRYRSRGLAREMIVSIGAASVALVLVIVLAQLMSRLGDEADLGLDLAVVTYLLAGGCFVYAGQLLRLAQQDSERADGASP